MSLKPAIGALLLGAAWSAHAACPSDSGRFIASGGEVTDTKTGLVWARCSVGQTWGGSICSGSATLHTHYQAMVLAQLATGWRLPNIKELASIVDRGCEYPAINSDVFVANHTATNQYWSSSPYVGLPTSAWSVAILDGYMDFYDRNNLAAVRLVRADR